MYHRLIASTGKEDILLNYELQIEAFNDYPS